MTAASGSTSAEVSTETQILSAHARRQAYFFPPDRTRLFSRERLRYYRISPDDAEAPPRPRAAMITGGNLGLSFRLRTPRSAPFSGTRYTLQGSRRWILVPELHPVALQNVGGGRDVVHFMIMTD